MRDAGLMNSPVSTSTNRVHWPYFSTAILELFHPPQGSARTSISGTSPLDAILLTYSPPNSSPATFRLIPGTGFLP
jgi:hypothetical protein